MVDARQALHFRLIFEVARRAGWLTDEVEAVHVVFGTVLGPRPGDLSRPAPEAPFKLTDGEGGPAHLVGRTASVGSTGPYEAAPGETG